jgi:hypothetical protein
VVAWLAAVAGAAEIQLQLALHGQVGEPFGGAIIRTVPVPTPVRPPQSVTTEAGGWTLTCSGRRREVEVVLAYRLVTFPENAPQELECSVGEHRLIVQVHNDHEVAWRLADHPTLRLREENRVGTAWGFRLGPGWSDAPGRLVGSDHQPVVGLVCRIERECLVVEQTGVAAPGAYRCVVEGHPTLAVEVLPPPRS